MQFPNASYARTRRNARSLHVTVSLCMPLCISLSACPTRASMHFTVYLPYACLYAFPCTLSLCMPLCASLCSCPMRVSMHFTVYVPSTCLYAFHYLLCACLCAFHCLLCLCNSLSSFPMQLSSAERNDLTTSTFPMQFTIYFPYAVELCRTQRLYRKNPSQCFREKKQIHVAVCFEKPLGKTRERVESLSEGHLMLATKVLAQAGDSANLSKVLGTLWGFEVRIACR